MLKKFVLIGIQIIERGKDLMGFDTLAIFSGQNQICILLRIVSLCQRFGKILSCRTLKMLCHCR